MKIICNYCGHYGHASNANKVQMGVAFHCPSCNRSTPHHIEGNTETAAPAVLTLMSPQERIARVFSALLMAELGFPVVEEIVGENNRRNDDTCASHDHCDANEYMAFAFTLTGRDSDPDTVDRDLWSAAWETAKTNEFFINDVLPPQGV